MRTDDFDYNLPEELIAQAPAEPRDSCRLLVVDRKGSQAGTPLEHGGTVEHRIFRDIIDYIEPGDVLVINQTRVMPARLIGRKAGSGGVVETLLLKRREDVDPLGHVWECLVKPGKRLKPGVHIEYRAGGAHAPEGAPVVLTAEVVDFVTDSRGGRLVRFEPAGCNAAGAAHARRGHSRRRSCAVAALHYRLRGRSREISDRVRHEGGALGCRSYGGSAFHS